MRLPEGAEYKYLALDGHRRQKASMELVQEGYEEFEFVPAVIKSDIDADIEEAVLVMMNSTQRNKTDWEKVMEHMRLKEIIPKMKKRKSIDGRARKIEADFLDVSEGQVAIYNTIGTKLSEDLMDWFRKGAIGISIAYEAAKCDKDCQEKIVQILHEKEKITEDDIRCIADRRAMEKSIMIVDIPAKQETGNENVTESVTLEAELDVEPKAKEKKNEMIWLKQCKEEYEKAINAIFEKRPGNTYPKDKMDEILEKYRQGSSNHIGQQLIFDRMLPFENDMVQVIYWQCGYDIKYIRTNESIHIPITYFGQTFKEYYYELTQQDQNKDNSGTNADVENVTESVTSKKYVLRGGYEVEQLNVLIQQYKQYYNISLMNNDKNKYKYACLLDALEILKTNMEQQAKETAGKE